MKSESCVSHFLFTQHIRHIFHIIHIISHYPSCYTVHAIFFFMYYGFYFVSWTFFKFSLQVCPFYFHIFIVICRESFYVLLPLFSPLFHCFLCVLCHCVCVCTNACLYLCVCACSACCHDIPEEDGRPRRRRTPRFLLKPWTHPYRPQKVGWACR